MHNKIACNFKLNLIFLYFVFNKNEYLSNKKSLFYGTNL